MKVGYFYKHNVEFGSIGTPLAQHDLKSILNILPKLPKNHKKHMVGSIWFHTNDKIGVEFNPVSDGIVCCDIDAISKEDCKKIMDNFDTISLVFPCIVSCWYSHSYYNKNYGGLHVVINTFKNSLHHDDFAESSEQSYRKQNELYSAALASCIYDICGIDVRPKYNASLKKTAGLDKAMLKIGQQCFLNYTETVKWNDNILKVNISDSNENNLRKWFSGYNWFSVDSDYKIVSSEVKNFNWKHVLSDDFKVNTNGFYKDTQLGHNRRIAVENFLAGLDWELEDIVNFMLKICFGDDFNGGEEKLKKAIIQTSRTAISKYRGKPSDFYTEQAKDILTALGVDIEVDIKKIYQPIDYDFDSIFEEVWEESKDLPYFNVYYNPRNFLKINLTKDQYLTDYKHEINEMITKYQMTYLVADCMVGKTHYAMNMQSQYGFFDDDEFIIHFKGDTIDVCVPYNSVADNKAKSNRKDIKRVKTENIKNFNVEKRNVFIWNTVMPLYEEYFRNGIVKRMVLFFDESQKLITDDYRWETVFEMFKVLPSMYSHFVFMTGTPAGELEFLTQYFKDYCVIKVDKEIDFNRECKILKYDKFGMGDRIRIIEDVIEDGKLPLIYSNSKNSEWKEACIKINKNRIDNGLDPLHILVYDRPNAERLETVNKTNSIKQYDVVIATKYCSVGIDFQKDDTRMRCSIIDFAGERECTFHDIWQFTLRNRKQDTITKLIVNSASIEQSVKLYNYWHYKQLFMDMAKIHTYKMAKPLLEDEEEIGAFNFAQEIFQIRKFGKLVGSKVNWFDDDKNVTLLGLYYIYVKIFGNMNVIKHMLKKRGVNITEMDMTHQVEKLDYTTKKDIYSFFIEHFEEIGNIKATKGCYDKNSYQIDINSDELENIKDNKIYSRNVHYMDWLIKQFGGNKEWFEILKNREYITPETFATYNRMAMIARRISKKEIDKIKRFRKVMIEEDFDDMVVDLVNKHYAGALNITTDEFKKAMLINDIINDYKKILRFSIDNIEFIEEIKNATSEGQRIAACHKMKIAMEQQEAEVARKKMSDAGKKNGKQVTVKLLKNNKEKTFGSMQEAADYFKVTKQTFYKFMKTGKGHLSNVIQVISFQ